MNLVSIQGPKALGYSFNNEDIHVCHQLMKGLSDSNYLVVSSKFRTDILYSSLHEKNRTIVKLWCLFKRKEFNDMNFGLFFRSIGTIDSVQNFFIRLLLLSRIPAWHQLYLHSLASAIKGQRSEIATIVSECAQSLSDRMILSRPIENTQIQEDSRFEDARSIVMETLSKFGIN